MGKTSHFQIRIDTAPPREFTPRVSAYSRLIEYQTLVYFETADDFSGIDHYEVSVVDLSEPESSPSFFTEEISPYKIPYKKQGKYNIIIRAIDKAGNIRENETTFRLMAPFITHIKGQGLEIKSVLFPWWLIGILGFLLIIGAWGLIWRVLKRAKRYIHE